VAVAPPELGEDATIIINKAAHDCGFDGDLEPGALEAEGLEAGGHGEFGDSRSLCCSEVELGRIVVCGPMTAWALASSSLDVQATAMRSWTSLGGRILYYRGSGSAAATRAVGVGHRSSDPSVVLDNQ